MKVTILKRSQDSFRLRVETKDELGLRKFSYETVRGTRAAAEARADELRRNIVAPAAVSSLKIGQGFTDWVDTRCEYGEIRRSTATLYHHLAQPLLKIAGHIKLTELNRRQVDLVYKTLVKSHGAQRANMVAVLFRTFLKDAVAKEIIPHDPSEGVAAPKAQKKIKKKTLTPEQMAKLVTQSRDWGMEGLIIRFALATGCRRSEICALQWDDFDLVKGTVRIQRTISMVGNTITEEPPKTESGNRTVVIPKALVDELLTLQRDGLQSKWVFHEHGRQRNPNRFTQFVKRRLKAIGLGDFTLHDLRHAHATYLLSQRMPLKAVSQRLGHSDVRITLGIYTHVLPGDDETLAGAMNDVF